MKIIVVDDEKFALENLKNVIHNVVTDAEIYGFEKVEDAAEYLKNNECQIAFLDIVIRNKSGVEFAKKIKLFKPDINIIFVTAYDNYMSEAFKMHASGYLLKPVTEEKIKAEIEELRYPVHHAGTCRMRIQTFGNFEVFVDETPVKFDYSKTKEMLAYLVDRNGAFVTNGELMAVLWEYNDGEKKSMSYLKNLKSDLINTLCKLGINYEFNHKKLIIRDTECFGFFVSLLCL